MHSLIVLWVRKAVLVGIIGGALVSPVRAADAIKIGVVNMLTGPLAEAGRFTVNGLTLAQEEINQAITIAKNTEGVKMVKADLKVQKDK